MGEKGELFLAIGCQLINIEGNIIINMMKLDNHHLATITVIDSGKNHQWW